MYKFTGRVRYSETNIAGHMRLHSIVNYLQDCSTFQSESVGQGIARLKERRRVWVLNSWQIIIENEEKLRFGNEIRVGTWMYEYKSAFASRNFMIEDMQGNRIVNADSLWVLIDLDTMKPTKISPDDTIGYDMEEKIDMPYAGRKIKVSGELEEKEPFAVKKYHIDTNNHVNNGSYIMMAEDFIPENFLTEQIRAEYRKAAVYGDIIYPYIETREDGYVIVLADKDKKPYALVELKGKN